MASPAQKVSSAADSNTQGRRRCGRYTNMPTRTATALDMPMEPQITMCHEGSA